MPITLNHSNINVQYSTGKNYIIETVKSDLYVRNKNVDTVIRNNIQTAPVTPTTFVDSSGNVYAVEAYTYSGTANTADYTRVFPKNTTCDILVVGGGGGGSAGGGGAGGYVYNTNITLNGTYAIKTAKGGAGATGSTNGSQGANSSLIGGSISYTAYGGGGGGGNNMIAPAHTSGQVGSYGGNGHDITTVQTYTSTQGNRGGRALVNSVGSGGGGGGAGAVGNDGSVSVFGLFSNPQNAAYYRGGQGGEGLVNNITGSGIYYAGGGTAGVNTNRDTDTTTQIEVLGGGGLGARAPNANGGNGTNGLGGGGGGGDWERTAGATGGSGIVIIKYLLGTIATTNFLTNEPTYSPDAFSIERMYPPIRNFTLDNSVISGQLYGNGTYIFSASSFYNLDAVENPYKICNNTNIAWTALTQYGASGQYSGSFSLGGFSGEWVKIQLPVQINLTKYILQHGQYEVQRSPSVYKIFGSNDNISWVELVNKSSALTTSSYISNMFEENVITSGYYNYFALVINKIIGQTFLSVGEWFLYGKEKVVAIPEGTPVTTHKSLTFTYNNDNLIAWYRFNGDYLDSSGNGHNLTNVGTVIQSTQIIEGQAVEFDGTDYLEFPSTINPYSIWNNGSGITFSFWIRFTAHGLWARLIDFQTAANTGSGLFLSVKSAPSTGQTAFYADIGNGTAIFKYSNWSDSLITTLGVWHHFVWCINKQGKWDIYLNNVRINGAETANIPNITYNLRYINKSAYPDSTWGGQMDDFRIYNKVLSTVDVSSLYNKTYTMPPNTYTLNFPVPTFTDINNNSNIVLQGTYDISLTSTNSSIIPKTNQHIPKPTTFSTSNISLRYSLLNPTLDPIGAQWTYSSNNTNVYHMGSVGIGTTSPEYHLDVRGNIFSSSGGYTQSGLTTWSIASDCRIKENIVKASYEKCLQNVKNIELYNFNFKDNYVKTNDRRQLGFIAQEVQQVYPKAVEVNRIISNNNDGIDNILSLNTTQIKYTLYGAVKNLIEKVENIESKVNNLYDKVFVKPILNTSNITSNITSNTSNITSISSNITSNTSNITSNTSNITSNTSNVEQQ